MVLRPSSKPGLLIALIVAATAALPACGGDDDNGGGTTQASDPRSNDVDAGERRQEKAQRRARGDRKGKDRSQDAGPERRGGPRRRVPSTDKPKPKPGSPEARATESLTKVYDSLSNLRDVDEASICDLMSESARRETRRYVTETANRGPGWTCEEAVDILVERSKLARGFRRVRKAEVVGVNIEGDRATATVSFGKGGALSPVSLVKEDGEWKLGSSPTGGE